MPTGRQQRLRDLTLTPGALTLSAKNINKKEGVAVGEPLSTDWNLCTLM